MIILYTTIRHLCLTQPLVFKANRYPSRRLIQRTRCEPFLKRVYLIAPSLSHGRLYFDKEQVTSRYSVLKEKKKKNIELAILLYFLVF